MGLEVGGVATVNTALRFAVRVSIADLVLLVAGCRDAFEMPLRISICAALLSFFSRGIRVSPSRLHQQPFFTLSWAAGSFARQSEVQNLTPHVGQARILPLLPFDLHTGHCAEGVLFSFHPGCSVEAMSGMIAECCSVYGSTAMQNVLPAQEIVHHG